MMVISDHDTGNGFAIQGVHQQLSKIVTLSTADGLGLLFDHQALF